MEWKVHGIRAKEKPLSTCRPSPPIISHLLTRIGSLETTTKPNRETKPQVTLQVNASYRGSKVLDGGLGQCSAK